MKAQTRENVGKRGEKRGERPADIPKHPYLPGIIGIQVFMQEARQSVESGQRCDTFGVYHDHLERDDNGRCWFAQRRYKSYARTNPQGPGPDLTVFELPEIPL